MRETIMMATTYMLAKNIITERGKNEYLRPIP